MQPGLISLSAGKYVGTTSPGRMWHFSATGKKGLKQKKKGGIYLLFFLFDILNNFNILLVD